MKINELFEAINGLNTLNQKYLPIKISYSIVKILQQYKQDYDFYVSKITEIIEKYGEKDKEGKFIQTEDGLGVQINPEDLENCQSEFANLVSIDVSDPENFIYISEFGSDFKISPDTLTSILPFLKE